MPTMQCQSGWFCKLNNVLLESTVALLFLVFSVNTKNNKKKIYKNTVYICKKNYYFLWFYYLIIK